MNSLDLNQRHGTVNMQAHRYDTESVGWHFCHGDKTSNIPFLTVDGVCACTLYNKYTCFQALCTNPNAYQL